MKRRYLSDASEITDKEALAFSDEIVGSKETTTRSVKNYPRKRVAIAVWYFFSTVIGPSMLMLHCMIVRSMPCSKVKMRCQKAVLHILRAAGSRVLLLSTRPRR